MCGDYEDKMKTGTFAKSVVGGISTTTSDVNPCRIRLCGEAAGSRFS